MARYFRAFRYLTSIELTPAERSALGSLPPEVRKAAAEWISTYAKLIAPSRAPLVWDDAGKKTGTAPWARYPVAEARTFPLSWGFDNEAMHGTVFHSTWPEPKQIKGPKGPRLMPSGLDVAVALGSETARQALRADGELKDYPPLEGALDALADHWKKAGRGKGSTLYDKWLEALAVQWSEASPSPGGKTSEPLWRTKRLQSGLASWATLRHATVLVNERVVAECGEAGFEELVMRTPRGAVEADPETFEAIATLFDALKAHVETAVPKLAGSEPTEPYGEAKPRNVKEGLLARLTEAARKTRHFADMAKRQAAGQALTDEEYDEIIWVGRVVEHAFLVFKSLGSKDLALSNPEDMAKIADVALGGAGGPYRHVAVGRSLEFDQIVPFYGRRQLVKGPVYSYYEVDDAEPLDDEKWRERVDKAERPRWVTPYLVKAKLSCPVNAP
jgi:hypothetical protein